MENKDSEEITHHKYPPKKLLKNFLLIILISLSYAVVRLSISLPIITKNIEPLAITDKINFLGDSITYGVRVNKHKRYTDLIANYLNITSNNYGVCGSQIAVSKKRNDDFNTRALNMDPTANFTFVFGGTNDYGHGDAKLGNPEDNTTSTFYGALNVLVNQLLTHWDNEHICFILPLPRYNEQNPKRHGPLKTYRKIMIDVLNRNKIDMIDFHRKFPVPTTTNESYYFADGLHLNDKGHKYIANMLVKYLKKKGFKNKIIKLVIKS